MADRTARRRRAAYIAAAGGVAYAASKVHFAVLGVPGVDGFRVTPAAAAAFGDATAAQLGNAALGAAAAIAAVALVRPPRSRTPWTVLLGANAVGAAFIAAGVVGFTLRALGVTSSPDWEPAGAEAWAALAVGWTWIAAWAWAIAASVRARRASGGERPR